MITKKRDTIWKILQAFQSERANISISNSRQSQRREAEKQVTDIVFPYDDSDLSSPSFIIWMLECAVKSAEKVLFRGYLQKIVVNNSSYKKSLKSLVSTTLIGLTIVKQNIYIK